MLMAKPSSYIEFEPTQRCEACQKHQRSCLIRDGDDKCKTCVDLSLDCEFIRLIQVKRPPSKFSWNELIMIDPPGSEWSAGKIKSVKAEDAKISDEHPPSRLFWLADIAISENTSSFGGVQRTPTMSSGLSSNPSWPATISTHPTPQSPTRAEAASEHKDASIASASNESDRPHDNPFFSTEYRPSVASAGTVRNLAAATSTERMKTTSPQPSRRKEIWCDVPLCSHRRPFGTRNDLDRHRFSVHKIPVEGQKVYVCQGSSCVAGGKTRQWPRKDNFKNHCKVAHPGEELDRLLRSSEVMSTSSGHRPLERAMTFAERGRSDHIEGRDYDVTMSESPERLDRRYSWASAPADDGRVDSTTVRVVCLAPDCNAKRPSSADMEHHLTNDHKDLDIEKAREYECVWPECGKRYKTFADMRRHQDSPHYKVSSDGSFVCRWIRCGLVFKTTLDLDRHYNSKHRSSNSASYGCPHPECSRVGHNAFRRKDHLKEHQERKHGKVMPRIKKRKVDKALTA